MLQDKIQKLLRESFDSVYSNDEMDMEEFSIEVTHAIMSMIRKEGYVKKFRPCWLYGHLWSIYSKTRVFDNEITREETETRLALGYKYDMRCEKCGEMKTHKNYF